VTTMQIYWGAVPFVLIQVIMIALVILVPQMVMVYKDDTTKVDPSTLQLEMTPAPDAGAGTGAGGTDFDAKPVEGGAPSGGGQTPPDPNDPFKDAPAPPK